jgi:hypothetical protein
MENIAVPAVDVLGPPRKSLKRVGWAGILLAIGIFARQHLRQHRSRYGIFCAPATLG